MTLFPHTLVITRTFVSYRQYVLRIALYVRIAIRIVSGFFRIDPALLTTNLLEPLIGVGHFSILQVGPHQAVNDFRKYIIKQLQGSHISGLLIGALKTIHRC